MCRSWFLQTGKSSDYVQTSRASNCSTMLNSLKISLKRSVDFARKMHELIKTWRRNEHKFKEKVSKEYAIAPLSYGQYFINIMLYRIFGRKEITHFPLDLVPLIQNAFGDFSLL